MSSLSTSRLACDPLDDDLVGDLERTDEVELVTAVRQHLIEQDGLRGFAREAIEDPVLRWPIS